MSFISEGKPPRYIVRGIDSTLYQYVIKLIRVSDQSIYTIYSSKVDDDRMKELLKEKRIKIKLGGCYRLRFYERIPPIADITKDRDGNDVHWFDINRLEGLYYDTRHRSIFKKYRWKTPMSKRIAKNIKNCEAIDL